MAKVKAPNSSSNARKMPPALTPEARENQLISLAIDVAEKQLLEGTASSQVITHFLKLATTREQLEKKRIEQEIELSKAKAKSLGDQEESKVLYENALKAMRKYSGYGDADEDY